MRSTKKVLIIDDEADLCMLLKSYFLKKKLDVTISHTLREGLSALHKIQPDIVFLDNNLPDGNGWEASASLIEDHPGIYLVLMSAFHPATPQISSNTHFQRIDKPISFSDLDKKLAVMLG